MARRALAILAAAAAAFAWLVAGAAGVGAHAVLRDSIPKGGAILDAPPTEVVIDFSEPPDLGLSEITIVDTEGRAIETGDLERAPGKGNRVRVSLPQIGEGAYTVTWRALSRVDGHLTAGAFSFGVGVEPAAVPVQERGAAAGVESPRPSPLSVIGRWGFYWGTALLLGGGVALLLVFRAWVRGAGILAALAWLLAAAGLIGMFFAERASVDVSVGTLLSSDRGTILIARAVALAVAGAATVYVAVRRSRVAAVLLLVTASVAMAVHAFAGHAGGATSWRWLKVGAQWVHIASVAVWVGGLVWLLVGNWGRETEERAGTVSRFSFIAGFALAGVAATGAARAVQEVGWAPSRLFETGFGLTVVAKTALFGALVAIGAYNRYRVVPAISSGAPKLGLLRRTVSGEITLATGVFGITGIMAGLVPPAQIATVAEAAPAHREHVQVSGADFARTVRVRLRAMPGMPGPNIFEVRMEDFDSGEPLPARNVRLRFSIRERPDIGASELPLASADPGLWRGEGTNLSIGGTWRVGVLIEQAADSLEIPLELKTRTAPQEVHVVEGKGEEPDVYTISLPEGRSVQAYVHSAEHGPQEIHFTFLDQAGDELPMEAATIEAMPADGEALELETQRLTPGHFVAEAELEPGAWRFGVEATAQDGAGLSTHIDHEVE